MNVERKIQIIKEKVGKPWANTVKYYTNEDVLDTIKRTGLPMFISLRNKIFVSIGHTNPSGWAGLDKVYIFDVNTSIDVILEKIK